MLTCCGLITLYQHRITDTRRELSELTREKETLQAQSARIWATFKGLEPYSDKDGKDYLLTPEGWTITYGGTLNKRDAWRITRK